VAPSYRFPYGHTHETQQEVSVYVIVRGSGRMKVDDEIAELKEWDAVRVPPGTWRGYEAGPEGPENPRHRRAQTRRGSARRRRWPVRLVD
jgi:mannose-6-phosphate isomerase-like protein (cupin superfamily)